MHDLAKSLKLHVTRKGGEGFGMQGGDIKCILSTELANVELSEKHDSKQRARSTKIEETLREEWSTTGKPSGLERRA